jgi:hypothetical protein
MERFTTKASHGMMAVNMYALVKMLILDYIAAHPSKTFFSNTVTEVKIDGSIRKFCKDTSR